MSEDDGHLHVVPLDTSTQQAQRHCVDQLRQALARAERGDFTQVAVLAIQTDNTYHVQWSNNINHVPFIGLCETLKALLIGRLQVKR